MTFSFTGHDTPIAPLKTLLRVVQALPGDNALTFQIHCMEQLCRVFAGDPNLKPELDANMRNMRPEDRRDMLRGVPGAAPVEDDSGAAASTSAPDTTQVLRRRVHAPTCTAHPAVEELVTESGVTLRLRRRRDLNDGVLEPIPGLLQWSGRA